MSNLTTDQMAEIIIRSARETAQEFARKRAKARDNGKKPAALLDPMKKTKVPAESENGTPNLAPSRSRR